MRSVKSLTWALAIAVLAAGSPLRAAEPDVLKLVPDQAQLVVVIPNLADLSDKLGKVATALNVPMPELQQPLQQLKGMLGIQKGLNDQGSFAFAMPSIPLGTPPQVLVFIPV